MKVAFLTTTMFSRVNGPSNFAVNLYDLADSNAPSEIDMQFVTEDKNNEVGVLFVPTKWSSRFRQIGMIIKSIEYYKAIKNIEFDVKVWNFSILGWYAIFKKKDKAKNIVFVNDQLSLDCKFNLSYSYLRYKIFRIFESFACKKADHVITNSEVLKRKLIENYKIKEEKVTVLYKGIKIPNIEQVKNNWTINRDNVIKISFVKTNYIEGGFEILCEALEKLTHFNFEIIVVGPLKIDKANVKYKNIKINCLGRLNKKELYNTITKTDLYCVPCINEAFGQANIEALSLQIPTIILPTEIQISLHSKEYCWISKECNALSLSDEISKIINETESVRKEKSTKAREIMETKYSIQSTSIIFNKIVQNTSNG
jgi:glycosyltransferase involved in cell wall biosynthesis